MRLIGQAYFQGPDGGTPSKTFSAYSSPDAGKCKNALQNYPLALKVVKGSTSVNGQSGATYAVQDRCSNSQFSNPVLYYNNAKIGTCSQADFGYDANENSAFVVQCTLSQA